MHVAVDLDDVVLDFMGGLRIAVLKEYGVDVGEFTKWDLHDVLDPVIGRSWWSWLRERDWLWPNFPAMDGAIGHLDKLRRDGHYLELVTSKPEWADYAVWKWLGKWRPPFHRVTIVRPEERKDEATDAAVLLDDKPQTIREWRGASRHAFLFDRPHNADASDLDIWRVYGWTGAYETIKELNECLSSE